MPVKAGVIRARCAHHKAGRRRDLHRYRVPGSGDHCRGAVAPWRFGRYVHAGCMHGVALPPGWADALLFVRRRPHLLQRREAASAEPGRYGQYPAGYDALAWGSARSPVLASGGPGGSTGTSRAPLRQTRDAHCAARGSLLWTTRKSPRVRHAATTRLTPIEHIEKTVSHVSGLSCQACSRLLINDVLELDSFLSAAGATVGFRATFESDSETGISPPPGNFPANVTNLLEDGTLQLITPAGFSVTLPGVAEPVALAVSALSNAVEGAVGVPEPSTLALLSAGLLGFGMIGRRRTRA